ncbi:MAG: carboxylesterase family protein [Hyphomicrobiales bacterium]|nr:carboxylesterase family protein [Hyphomicrobiales bacterium]MCP4998112.1 carboxylesterase family protein [Hyphomicrobiales bacterium]
MRLLNVTGVLLAVFLLLTACVNLVLEQPASDGRADKPDCTAPTVETTSGRVCGLATAGDNPIHRYLGIPYAEPTSGANRWTPPIPAAKRPGTIRTTAFGPICPQSAKQSPFAQSEDCLSVNVWTPVTAGKGRRPVMVFIHGGAFIFGSSANPLYDGRVLATRGDVVVVTMNYRLGALGFLAGIEGLRGNYGFLDQQLVLKWVHDNIAAFGGDPARVTLFGESAGAASVGLHLMSPASQRYFRAAIMESNPHGLPYKSMDEAARFGARFRSALGCGEGDIDCLRSRPFKTVAKHEASLRLKLASLLAGFSGQLVWAPVIDSKTIKAQPNQGAISKTAIVGSNRNEGIIFANTGRIDLFGRRQIPRAEYGLVLELLFSKPAAEKIKAISRYAPVPGDNTDQFSHVLTDYVFTCANHYVMGRSKRRVYGYKFNHVPSYDVWPQEKLCAPKQQKVCHTFELPFVFGSPTTVSAQKPPVHAQFTPAEKQLSDRMIQHWTRFATTLAPGWTSYSNSRPDVQLLGEALDPPRSSDANCAFWDTLGYDLPGLYDRMHEKSR